MNNSDWVKWFKARTKKFAVDVIRFSCTLPNKSQFWVISKQLIKSATSVAANYRSACRGQSRAAFIAKMAIVEEEADESRFWLEVLDDLKTRENKELTVLLKEAGEILAVSVASKKTARNHAAQTVNA